jgi:hypothetical protein
MLLCIARTFQYGLLMDMFIGLSSESLGLVKVAHLVVCTTA